MNTKVMLVLAPLLAVAFAGCSDDGDNADPLDIGTPIEEVKLKAGKGAIAGLLVDDRFRPIHLTDDATSEFQTTGFILLQEEGAQTQTTANGEFSFIDIDPGQYTLRVQAAGHETGPLKVTVVEGEFAEATILARRVSSEGSFIVTEEFSGFTPCAASWPSPGSTGLPAPAPGAVPASIVFGCNDSSGESYRPGPTGLNYSGLMDEATYMVVELLVEKEGHYLLVVRHDDGTTGGGDRYGAAVTEGGRYAKVIMKVGDIHDEEMNANPLDLSKTLAALNFYRGSIEETNQDNPNGGTFGNTGVDVATKSQFMISLFMGEPEVDLETYQLLDESSS